MRIEGSAVIHQPHFFPWPPYLARVAACEVFVIQDSVQFRKAYFHNRTRILTRSGQAIWATIPVHAPVRTPIKEVLIDAGNRRVVLKFRNILKDAYGKTASFQTVWERLDEFLKNIGKTPELSCLSTLNAHSILLLLGLLRVTPPRIIYASDLGVHSETRTARLVEMLKSTGCATYLTGWGASTNPDVHDLDVLSSNGIRPMGMERSKVDGRVPEFTSVEGLSTLHWVFTWGVDATKDRLGRLSDSFTEIFPPRKVQAP